MIIGGAGLQFLQPEIATLNIKDLESVKPSIVEETASTFYNANRSCSEMRGHYRPKKALTSVTVENNWSGSEALSAASSDIPQVTPSAVTPAALAASVSWT